MQLKLSEKILHHTDNYCNSNTAYNVNNFIMNINSLFAVSFENTWGNVRVNGKEYLLNFGEKKKTLFFIVPPVGDEVVWQKYDFF